jgi:hypothetical protein
MLNMGLRMKSGIFATVSHDDDACKCIQDVERIVRPTPVTGAWSRRTAWRPWRWLVAAGTGQARGRRRACRRRPAGPVGSSRMALVSSLAARGRGGAR